MYFTAAFLVWYSQHTATPPWVHLYGTQALAELMFLLVSGQRTRTCSVGCGAWTRGSCVKLAPTLTLATPPTGLACQNIVGRISGPFPPGVGHRLLLSARSAAIAWPGNDLWR